MFSDKYGRKTVSMLVQILMMINFAHSTIKVGLYHVFTIIFQSLCFGACWVLFYGILSGCAPNVSWLLLLRFLVGLGLGAIPQA